MYDRQLQPTLELVTSYPGETQPALAKIIKRMRGQAIMPNLGRGSLLWKLRYLELRGDVRRDDRDRWYLNGHG